MEKQQLDFTAPLLSVRRRDMKGMHEKTVPGRRDALLVAGSELNFDHVTKPAAVPFIWEDIPGKARKKLDDCNVNDKGSGDMGNEDGDDDGYSDVLDAFSQSTVSRDCCVSSWSGSDGLGVEPSRILCTSQDTCDFILRRFLPAAKAMTLELPCHVTKRKSLVLAQEQPTVVKEMVSEDQKPLLKRNDSWIVTYFEQIKEVKQQDEQKQESESAVDHYNDKPMITSAKSHGFLPRFCIKSSTSLLNQVAGMKHTTQSPKGSKGEARRHKKAYRGPRPRPLSPNTEKEALDAICNHKCDDAAYISKFNNARYTGHSQTTGRSSLTPNRGSPYRKKTRASPSRQMMGLTSTPKATDQNSRACTYDVNINNGHENNPKVVSDQTHELGPGPDYVSPRRVEETLHMDLVKAFELHPPLPKSPSDSWLTRTLPSVPSRSSSPHSRKVSLTQTHATSTKWENIVKTSYMHRDHVRYSQELVGNVGKQLRSQNLIA